MTTEICGRVSWSGSRDQEGHRTYKVKHRIKGALTDGPFTALNTPGLPLPGAFWLYGNEIDPWAFCQPTASLIGLPLNNEAHQYWDVENEFTTKRPPPDIQRCQDQSIEDPLLEPMKVSGTFTKMSREATHDRFGFPITSSSWEQIRGPTVVFDESRPTVHIEQNVALLQLDLITSLRDTTNLTTQWGLSTGTIKLTGISWDKVYYGQCGVYYTRKFDFDIDFAGWDRRVLDEGSKVLHGHWDANGGRWTLDTIGGAPPNRFNPQHFDRAVDKQGNPMRMLLNGAGLPAEVSVVGNSQYVSVAINNVGNPLTSTLNWRPCNRTTAIVWDDATAFVVGDLVVIIDVTNQAAYYYVAIVNNTNSQPPNANWIFLGSIQDKGGYDVTATYQIGDIVRGLVVTGFGSIFLSKYVPANHFLLGIPVVL